MESKLHDILLQKLKREPSTNWKKVGLELKFTEFIENLEVEDFEAPEKKKYLNHLTDKLVTIVEDLSIQKIKPRRRYERNPFNPKARVVNFSSNECSHGSLEFLGQLINLRSLKLKFDPGNLGLNYERRFFLLSTIDIENLGKALASMEKLENFAIHKSDLGESMKIRHLLMPMRSMEHLKVLDLSFCRITSKESGEYFSEFLNARQSLKSLELKGNNLNSEFCVEFARGIENFKGKLEFLGLSLTSIFGIGNGLCSILRCISKKNNVKRLDFSHCDNFLRGDNDACPEELNLFIAQESETLVINMQGNKFISEEIKENFIKALCKNFEIDEVHCEECGELIIYYLIDSAHNQTNLLAIFEKGFSSDQMMKVKILLDRNKFYKLNPMLKKNHFTFEDEVEIEKSLTRTKHPLLLKYKRSFVPNEDDVAKKPLTFEPKLKPKAYKKLASSLGHESRKCRL